MCFDKPLASGKPVFSPSEKASFGKGEKSRKTTRENEEDVKHDKTPRISRQQVVYVSPCEAFSDSRWGFVVLYGRPKRGGAG